MNLTTEAEHKAAVKEFWTLATDEAANYARLLVLRDAIHAFEEANGHHPAPPTTVAGRLQVEILALVKSLVQRSNGRLVPGRQGVARFTHASARRWGQEGAPC